LHVAHTQGKDVAMLVLAADHLIADHGAFSSAVEKAVGLAKTGKLVTFGITPESPETGYGYIEADDTIVKRFVEKPSQEKAKEYVDSGRFLWNSGMFCFTVENVLAQMQDHCPDILASV